MHLERCYVLRYASLGCPSAFQTERWEQSQENPSPVQVTCGNSVGRKVMKCDTKHMKERPRSSGRELLNHETNFRNDIKTKIILSFQR